MLTIALAGAQAQAPPQASPTSQTPDHIEEDWQLVVSSPDIPGVGPQITTVMSPTGDVTGAFVSFDMNYREYPTFVPGGMQVQGWSGKTIISTASEGSDQFQTSNETVSWTQVMSISSGGLYYDVNNGQSTTWGKFGQGTNLSVAYTTSVTDLSGYSPRVTVANSGASWESNRVTSLKLVQVRYYSNGNLYYTDSTVRTLVDNSNTSSSSATN